jgi:hypothetical protein
VAQLVAHLSGGQGVASSSLAIPTSLGPAKFCFAGLFLCLCFVNTWLRETATWGTIFAEGYDAESLAPVALFGVGYSSVGVS